MCGPDLGPNQVIVGLAQTIPKARRLPPWHKTNACRTNDQWTLTCKPPQYHTYMFLSGAAVAFLVTCHSEHGIMQLDYSQLVNI